MATDQILEAQTSLGVSLHGIGMVFEAGGQRTEAIRSVSATMPSGRFVTVIGPSGCGKSTLLDLVFGLQMPTTGYVTIDGEPVTGPRRDMSMVFQEDSTLHWRTVQDNVAFGLEVAGVRKSERRRRAEEMIKLVGLSGFEDYRPRQLSGGMKQRVAIARSLVMEPRILLMDEPFGALDQQTRWRLGGELTRIWEETRNSVLFVTHDIHEAIRLSDVVWVMSERPSELKTEMIVDLPRPRTDEVLSDPRFTQYAAQLWELLLPEIDTTSEAVSR